MSGVSQELFVAPDGVARGLYGELIDAGALGAAAVVRASHVEPADGGGWAADLSPVGGPTLGPFPLRSEALAAEADWLVRHRLATPGWSPGFAFTFFPSPPERRVGLAPARRSFVSPR